MRVILLSLLMVIILAATCAGCGEESETPATSPASSEEPATTSPPGEEPTTSSDYPRIASWLAKKDQIIESGKPYDLVMTALFMPDEAGKIREANPDVKLLAGFTTNWVWQNEAWIQTLLNVANHGSEKTFELTDDMYLRKPGGDRCPFGWESESWGQEEIYSMDPTNPEWVELITTFYKTLLEQPQHDGIVIDMVIETSLCREAISDEEWIEATRDIMAQIQDYNTEDKLVVFNSGRDISEIDEFAEYMDGYLMENFLGSWGADYETGLEAADSPYLIVYAVDTENTGEKNLNKMRLGLILSLLNDNTYFTYDFGPRDHGQAWWFPEYNADLGQPAGDYYEKDGAYWRDFEMGIVVSAPDSPVSVTFEVPHKDVSSGKQSTAFEVDKGDGRIFFKTGY
ncbi:MAG: putative glycoside hydrolase [Dehalococcoidia bacterium]